jgi:hypothetical protein
MTSPCGNIPHGGISGIAGPTILMDCGPDNHVECLECPDSGNGIEVGEVEAETCANMVVNRTKNEDEAVNM